MTTEAQLIRDQASLITKEELKEIRIRALDEMWTLKKNALDFENKSLFEKSIIYAKAFSYEVYIRSIGYYTNYAKYLEHEYKWRLYNELKTHKVRIPQPQNYIASENTYPIDRTIKNDDDQKYPNE